MKNNKVLHNIHQELTAAEKTQARENIGIINILLDSSPTISDANFQKLIGNFENTIIQKGGGSVGTVYTPNKQDTTGYHFTRFNHDNKILGVLNIDYDKNITIEEISLGNSVNYIHVECTKTSTDRTFTIPANKKWNGIMTFTFNLTNDKNNCYVIFRNNDTGTFGDTLYVNGSNGKHYTISIGFEYNNDKDTDTIIYLNRNGIDIADIENITFTGVEV